MTGVYSFCPQTRTFRTGGGWNSVRTHGKKKKKTKKKKKKKLKWYKSEIQWAGGQLRTVFDTSHRGVRHAFSLPDETHTQKKRLAILHNANLCVLSKPSGFRFVNGSKKRRHWFEDASSVIRLDELRVQSSVHTVFDNTRRYCIISGTRTRKAKHSRYSPISSGFKTTPPSPRQGCICLRGATTVRFENYARHFLRYSNLPNPFFERLNAR